MTEYTPEQKKRVAALIEAGLKGYKPPKRSANEVTADRLRTFLDTYGEHLSGPEHDAFGVVIHTIETIEETS